MNEEELNEQERICKQLKKELHQIIVKLGNEAGWPMAFANALINVNMYYIAIVIGYMSLEEDIEDARNLAKTVISKLNDGLQIAINENAKNNGGR